MMCLIETEEKWIEAKESFQLIELSFIKSSIKTELLA